MAAKRLNMQDEAEKKSQAAVHPMPTTRQQQDERQHGEEKEDQAVLAGETAPRVQADPIAPEPKRPWVTKSLSAGRKLFAHADTLQQRISVAASRFADLDNDGDEDEEKEQKTEERPPPAATIDISSSDEVGVPVQAVISEEEKAELHLVQGKPPKIKPTPQLVALKQRERAALAVNTFTLRQLRGSAIRHTEQSLEEITDFAGIEKRLGLRQVVTPASGNCMAMALVQAVADQDLATSKQQLEGLTAIIKRGIGWTGQLNFLGQFDDFARKATLINVQRGWDGRS
ncbi:hypothetical protein PR003_g1800 [Phytophthora rubi]|nr:hypothetical protein PR003_g1800 [Phytophthora rubi]